jgi:hypothetical protein
MKNMQIGIIKKRYMKILLNIKSNAYKDNKELMKRDLIILRNILQFIDEPNEKMTTIEKCLTRRVAAGR